MRTGSFPGRDGARLGFREVGEGRTIVLLHGFFSTGATHWIDPGHAGRLAALGYRVVLPDLRGHGLSAGPSGSDAYPADVLVDDGLALLDHLAVSEFDLGGYSLGGRTAVRMMVAGAEPDRAVIAGMGLDSIAEPRGRGGRYRKVLANLGTFEEETFEWRAERHLRRIEANPEGLLHVLDANLPTATAELAAIEAPTLVVVGADDHAHRSAEQLADLLPDGTFQRVPGTHVRAITMPEIGEAIAAYLGDARR